jgi:hypothetical protein
MTIITTITASIVEKNGDNNCNTDDVEQEVYDKNECEIENDNDDHSHDNTNENTLSCVNDVQNINNAFSGLVL